MLTIFLFFSLLFGTLSVFTVKIKRSIIYMGIFSLFMSFLCLLYYAPDVAISEAAIGCSLSTILLLVAMKKNEKTIPWKREDFLLILFKSLLCIVGCILMISIYLSTSDINATTLRDYFTTYFYEDTGAKNAVAAIYLNYRIFDSIFETLMLLLSVMGVIYLSWRNQYEK